MSTVHDLAVCRAIAHLSAIVAGEDAINARAGRPPCDRDALFASLRAHGEMTQPRSAHTIGARAARRYDAALATGDEDAANAVYDDAAPE